MIAAAHRLVSRLIARLSRPRQATTPADAERRFRVLFELAPIGIVLVDFAAKHAASNRAARELFGLGVESPAELDALVARASHPGDLAEDAKLFDEVRQGLRPGYRMMKRYVRPDGSTVHGDLRVVGVRDEAGALTHAFSLITDETERILAEEALRERTRELAEAQRLADLGSWRWDADTDTVTGSAQLCHIFGVVPGERPFRRADFDALVHPEDRPALADLERALRSGQERAAHQFRIVRVDGAVRHVRTLVEALREGGSRVGFRGVVQDITAQVHLEARAREAQRLESIGRLAGGVAHEFNNLLAIIRANADLLRAAIPDDAPEALDAEEIQGATDRAAALVRRLLAFGRRQMLRPRVLDLNGAIGRAAKSLRQTLGSGVELDIVLHDRPLWVATDPLQLERALIELAVNARAAMPDGGRLDVAVGVHDAQSAEAEHLPPIPHAVVRVADTGVGMREETVSHVFEPFFTTREVGQGAGLGLASVQGFVEQSGGRIRVMSEIGRGTTFTICLPVVPAPPETMRHAPRHGGGDRIRTALLAEDEAALRSVLRRALERAGFSVTEAASGDEALSHWAANPSRFDLVVTDLVMPGLGGDDLVHHLRHENPELPLVLISGYAEGGWPEEALRGPTQILAKPFAIGAFLASVEELVLVAASDSRSS